ncbi:hypothetical protein ACXJJ3_32890 [Kribbella sp. WER1]
MSTRQQVTHHTGQSFPVAAILGIAFVVLKLVGVISWSWLWVLAPFWIPIAVPLVICVPLFVIGGLLLLAAKLLEMGDKR